MGGRGGRALNEDASNGYLNFHVPGGLHKQQGFCRGEDHAVGIHIRVDYLHRLITTVDVLCDTRGSQMTTKGSVWEGRGHFMPKQLPSSSGGEEGE